MFKKIIYLILVLSLILNIILLVNYTCPKEELIEEKTEQYSFSNKIRAGTKNSVDLINKNISIFNIDKKKILLNEYNLLFYFNDKTCGSCIDEALVDLGNMVDNDLDQIKLIVSYNNKKDYVFLRERIDHKYPIFKIMENEIPFLSPTFLVVNKEGAIVNAHTYVKEFPDSNKLFLLSVNYSYKFNKNI